MLDKQFITVRIKIMLVEVMGVRVRVEVISVTCWLSVVRLYSEILYRPDFEEQSTGWFDMICVNLAHVLTECVDILSLIAGYVISIVGFNDLWLWI